MARAQDRLLGPCFKTGPGGTSICSLLIDCQPSPRLEVDATPPCGGTHPRRRSGRIHHAPDGTPRTVSPGSRNRPSELSSRYGGTNNGCQGPEKLYCRVGVRREPNTCSFRNGSQCPAWLAVDKCPAVCRCRPTASEYPRPDNRVQRA